MRTTQREQQIAAIVQRVATRFHSFGGGKVSEWNPLTHALKDQPSQFAAGVEIEAVVRFVLDEANA